MIKKKKEGRKLGAQKERSQEQKKHRNRIIFKC